MPGARIGYNSDIRLPFLPEHIYFAALSWLTSFHMSNGQLTKSAKKNLQKLCVPAVLRAQYTESGCPGFRFPVSGLRLRSLRLLILTQEKIALLQGYIERPKFDASKDSAFVGV